MTFDELVRSIRSRVDDNQPLKQMLEWLRNGQGFMHCRINDGESFCLTGLKPEHERNNCGHQYFRSLAVALQRMLIEIRGMVERGIASQSHPRIMVGGYWYMQYHLATSTFDPDEAAAALVAHCGADASKNQVGWLDKIPWVGSDDIVRGLTTDLPYQIFDFIRESRRPVYLVCNPRNEPGRHMLGAKFVPISRIDCWNDTPRIIRLCEILGADPSAIFVWCAGMSKSWIWDTWKRWPQTSHIDAGHLLDAVFGEASRAYTRRKDRREPLWRAYEDKFMPYAKRFVPS